MARQSAESLSIATVSIPIRPDPPKDLTEAQSNIWRDIVATKPPDWFEADSQPVLAAYCRAVDFHSKISMELDKYLNENEDIIPAKQLYDLQEKNARLMKNLAAGLRLTPQSRYTPKAAATANKKAGGAAKPWN